MSSVDFGLKMNRNCLAALNLQEFVTEAFIERNKQDFPGTVFILLLESYSYRWQIEWISRSRKYRSSRLHHLPRPLFKQISLIRSLANSPKVFSAWIHGA